MHLIMIGGDKRVAFKNTACHHSALLPKIATAGEHRPGMYPAHLTYFISSKKLYYIIIFCKVPDVKKILNKSPLLSKKISIRS